MVNHTHGEEATRMKTDLGGSVGSSKSGAPDTATFALAPTPPCEDSGS